MSSHSRSTVYYGLPFITMTGPCDEGDEGDEDRNSKKESVFGIEVENGIIVKLLYTKQEVDLSVAEGAISVDLGSYSYEYPHACVTPGFVMSHTHLSTYCILSKSVNVSAMNTFFDPDYFPPRSSAEVLVRLRDYLRDMDCSDSRTDSHANPSLFSQGYDPVLQPGKVISREDLDCVSTEIPIYLMSASMHTIYVNTQVLIISGLATFCPDTLSAYRRITLTSSVPENARAEVMRGTFSEENLFLISPYIEKVSPEELTVRMKEGISLLRKQGITTVADAAVQDTMLSFYKDYTTLSSLSSFSHRPKETVRIVCFPVYYPHSPFITPSHGSLVQLDYKKVFTNDYLSIGPMKVIGDGSVNGYTAYLTEPYFTPPFFEVPDPETWRGEYNYPKVELRLAFEDIIRAGMNIAVHGNGDGDIDLIITALESVNKSVTSYPIAGRVRIEHASLLRKDQIVKLSELGVHVSFLNHHIYYYGDVFYDRVLGPERTETIHPAGSASSSSLAWDMHADSPVSPPSPLFQMWIATHRITQSGRCLGKEERVSPYDALKACTISSAQSIGMGEKVGTIEVGKFADFNILSHNPLKHDNRYVSVIESFLGGRS